MSLNPKSFPGANTPWKSVGGGVYAGFGKGDQLASEAVAKAQEVSALFDQMRVQAEAMATEAESQIERAANFSDRVSRVTYRSPQRTPATLFDIDDRLEGVPGVSDLNDGSLDPFIATLDEGEFSTGSTDAPTIGSLPNIPAPSVGGGQVGAPQAPNTGEINIRPAPDIAVSVRGVPEVPPVGPAPDLSVLDGDLGPDVLPPNLPLLDIAELDDAIDRLQNLTGRTVTIPRYDQRFPQVFQVTGSLLAGDLVIDGDAIILSAEGRNARASADHDRLMSNLWADRGLSAYSDTVVGLYNEATRAANEAQNLAEHAAAKGKWLDDALRQAYKLGVAAHGMMIGIEIALYDAKFRATLLSAQSAVQMGKAATAAYNAAAARFNAMLEHASVGYVRVEADAKRYRSRADMVEARGRLNGAIADAFGAQERAKANAGRMFAAGIGVNEARVQAQNAKMKALAAQADAMKVAVDNFRVRVLQWEAGAERTAAMYKQVSANARMTAAKNQMEASKMRLNTVRNEVVGVQARAIATQVQAQAARIRASITRESLRHASVEARNQVEAMKVQGVSATYDGEVGQWIAEMDAKIGKLEGQVADDQAAARFLTTTMEAKNKAAQLSQQALHQLAEAYHTATSAAAKAGATVNSGKLGGFRVSASLDASGSLGNSDNYNLSISDSYEQSVTESQSYAVKHDDEP
jgi:hypothetical protein